MFILTFKALSGHQWATEWYVQRAQPSQPGQGARGQPHSPDKPQHTKVLWSEGALWVLETWLCLISFSETKYYHQSGTFVCNNSIVRAHEAGYCLLCSASMSVFVNPHFLYYHHVPPCDSMCLVLGFSEEVQHFLDFCQFLVTSQTLTLPPNFPFPVIPNPSQFRTIVDLCCWSQTTNFGFFPSNNAFCKSSLCLLIQASSEVHRLQRQPWDQDPKAGAVPHSSAAEGGVYTTSASQTEGQRGETPSPVSLLLSPQIVNNGKTFHLLSTTSILFPNCNITKHERWICKINFI